jgi:hypothetical protein
VRGGKDFAAFTKLLEVGDQKAVEVALRFIASEAIGDTAGHVWGIGQIARARFLDNDEIFFHGAMRDLMPSGARVSDNNRNISHLRRG